MIENEVTHQSMVEATKSLVIDKSMWNSIIRRSGEQTFKNDKFPLEVDHQYKNYLYEGSRTMANKLKENVEALTKAKKEDHIEIERLKLNEQFFDDLENSRIVDTASKTVVASKKSLTRRKQDEYKAELREFIETRRSQQTDLEKAEREQQRLERMKIDSDLMEQLKKEQIMKAERKAFNRNIALESMQISGKTRRREKQMGMQQKSFQ